MTSLPQTSELALRRRLLFRLLRRFDFDHPRFEVEAITDPVRPDRLDPGAEAFRLARAPQHAGMPPTPR